MKNVWRKSKLTRKLLQELWEALERWWSISDACYLVGITRRTFYNWIEDNEKFADFIQFSKSNLERKSKDVVYDEIVDNKNISMAKWYLEKTLNSSKKVDNKEDNEILNSLYSTLDEIINSSSKK